MRKLGRPAIIIITAIAALSFGLPSHAAFAQQKKAPGAHGKHQACITKARAENPHPGDGHARQAAYNRCMGR